MLLVEPQHNMPSDHSSIILPALADWFKDFCIILITYLSNEMLLLQRVMIFSFWVKSIAVRTNGNLVNLDKIHSRFANVAFIFKANQLLGWISLEMK